MPRNKRILGGEKNPKSGKKWSKAEIKLVLILYLELQEKARDNQPKIHESNIEIQILGDDLVDDLVDDAVMNNQHCSLWTCYSIWTSYSTSNLYLGEE